MEEKQVLFLHGPQLLQNENNSDSEAQHSEYNDTTTLCSDD